MASSPKTSQDKGLVSPEYRKRIRRIIDPQDKAPNKYLLQLAPLDDGQLADIIDRLVVKRQDIDRVANVVLGWGGTQITSKEEMRTVITMFRVLCAPLIDRMVLEAKELARTPKALAVTGAAAGEDASSVRVTVPGAAQVDKAMQTLAQDAAKAIERVDSLERMRHLAHALTENFERLNKRQKQFGDLKDIASSCGSRAFTAWERVFAAEMDTGERFRRPQEHTVKLKAVFDSVAGSLPEGAANEMERVGNVFADLVEKEPGVYGVSE